MNCISAENKIIGLCTSDKIPNIMLHGCGSNKKLQLLNTFLSNVESQVSAVLHVDCIQSKGIQYIRDEVIPFAKNFINTHNGKTFKLIIIYKLENMSIEAQSALRRCIEKYNHTTRYFVLSDDKRGIMRPILSRLCPIYVSETVTRECVANMCVRSSSTKPTNAEDLPTGKARLRKSKVDLPTGKAHLRESKEDCFKQAMTADDVAAKKKETISDQLKRKQKYQYKRGSEITIL